MKSLVASLALLFLVSAAFAAPQGSPNSEYQYNITVVIPPNDNNNQEGKIWIVLEGKNNQEPFQHEIKLTPHSTPLRPGNSYSYYVSAPYPVEKIESALLYWKPKSWNWKNPGGVLGNELHVQKVVLEPAYVTGTIRTSATKGLCSTQDPVQMEAETKYKFFVACN